MKEKLHITSSKLQKKEALLILKDVNNPLNHKPAPPNTYHIMNTWA